MFNSECGIDASRSSRGCALRFGGSASAPTAGVLACIAVRRKILSRKERKERKEMKGGNGVREANGITQFADRRTETPEL